MKLNLIKMIRAARVAMGVSALGGLCWASYEVFVYLRTAPRFDVQKLSIVGLKRVQENQVLLKAGVEAGTNVFRINLDEVRKHVEELDWIRYAAVQRVLPDQIIVSVVEREPIGLTRINGEIYQFDMDGKILNPDPVSATSFPILEGLRAGDRKGNLQKVETYRNVLDQIGQTSLSEVHVSDTGEVTVVSASDPLSISLGMTEFRNRWIHYLQLKPQIQQQYPHAVRVDLRFKNQVIIKMKDDDTSEKVVWGTKKNTL